MYVMVFVSRKIIEICSPAATIQVLDSLSNGGTNLNDVSIAGWCGALVGLALVWRVVHYVALKRSIF